MHDDPSARSVFDIHRTDPELMFPIPAMPSTERGEGKMVMYIGKADGGSFGKKYRDERWYGEVIHTPIHGEPGEHHMLVSEMFYVPGPADHLAAARHFAETLTNRFSWAQRVFDWLYMSWWQS